MSIKDDGSSMMRNYDGPSSINKRPWERRESSRAPQATKKQPKVPSVSAWDLLQENQRRAPSFPPLMQPPQQQQYATGTGHQPLSSPHDHSERIAWMRLPPGLHEVAGEGGAGKSQIAMSLSVDVAASLERTHPSPVYYVSMRSTAKFVERLHQMVHARGADPMVLQRILIREVSNMESLLDLLAGLLQANFATFLDNNKGGSSTSTVVGAPPPPRLVVLDSVADLIRGEAAAAPGEGWCTYATLRRVARLARTFSERHGVAVLCVNQVTANVGTGTLKPALGLTWAQEMDRSYMVSRSSSLLLSASHPAEPKDALGPTNQLRTIELRRSSQFGPHKAQFTVQARGVSMMPSS
jgi:RecA/RadA recombinase